MILPHEQNIMTFWQSETYSSTANHFLIDCFVTTSLLVMKHFYKQENQSTFGGQISFSNTHVYPSNPMSRNEFFCTRRLRVSSARNGHIGSGQITRLDIHDLKNVVRILYHLSIARSTRKAEKYQTVTPHLPLTRARNVTKFSKSKT